MASPHEIHLWSATPTPLTRDLQVDEPSLVRLVHAGIEAGLTGFFVAGTCGEGPWLPERERSRLLEIVAREAQGRLEIAMQVSDNSVPRIVDNMCRARDAGATVAIVSHPPVMMNATPERLLALYEGAAAAAPLPLGIYDLGAHRAWALPPEQLRRALLLPNVVLLKDSSGEPARRAIALEARNAKPSLRLFNGDEFRCVDYLASGYDGMMFGGAAVVAPAMRRIARHFLDGELDAARQTEREMVALLRGVYGGASLACWLTGLKYFLTRQRIFTTSASFLEYPLLPECQAFIDVAAADPALSR